MIVLNDAELCIGSYCVVSSPSFTHVEFISCTSFSHSPSTGGSLWIRSQKERAATPTAIVIEARDDI